MTNGSPERMMAAVAESMAERTAAPSTSGCWPSTHKMGLAAPEDVTAEVEALARVAWEQNG
jgi:hypothetical protein